MLGFEKYIKIFWKMWRFHHFLSPFAFTEWSSFIIHRCLVYYFTQGGWVALCCSLALPVGTVEYQVNVLSLQHLNHELVQHFSNLVPGNLGTLSRLSGIPDEKRSLTKKFPWKFLCYHWCSPAEEYQSIWCEITVPLRTCILHEPCVHPTLCPKNPLHCVRILWQISKCGKHFPKVERLEM